MLLVFGLIGLVLVLFVTEPIPIDITAIVAMVALFAIDPILDLGSGTILSGFASSATITVLAMFVLSEGVRRTGIVQSIGNRIVDATEGSPKKRLAAVVGLSGGTAGFINNTPVVAIMIPMAMDIARRSRTSPSKLLMAISFASMMGGTLTLIGTSTNILASDTWDRIGGEATTQFSMFEFTQLGIVVLLAGVVYLLTIAPRLTPERIKPEEELTEEFSMSDYLTEVVVRGDSPLVGMTVRESLQTLDVDIDIVQVVRHGEAFMEPLARKELREGDVLVIRTDRDTLVDVMDEEGLDLLPEVELGDEDLEPEAGYSLVEVIVMPDTRLVGETLASLNFRQRYDATVLAIRRGGSVIRQRMDQAPLRGGDTLLIQATEDTVNRLSRNRSFVVAGEVDRPDWRKEKTPIAVGIVAAVVLLAAFSPYSILVTALAGMVAMVVSGCLKPNEVYDAVDWNVIFLLAGVIPLGIALERTGGADLLAALVVNNTLFLPTVAVLGVFYLLTAVLTNLISNNASVVLMIPVAIDTAQAIGANAFSFVLAVTFAASTAFMTPVGYQTNLMVYGPGGYTFTDFVRVGGPLQLLLAVVTTVGIWFFWGV